MKPALEFFDPKDLPWSRIDDASEEMILSKDEETGLYTRFLRFRPAPKSGRKYGPPLTHEFFEELYIIEGSIKDESTGRTYVAGMYACRPPGMKHGPFSSSEGCTIFEVRYASPKPLG
jgi:hypothetical protein